MPDLTTPVKRLPGITIASEQGGAWTAYCAGETLASNASLGALLYDLSQMDLDKEMKR